MPPLHLWSARPLPSHSPKGNPVWLISFQSHFDSNFGTFGVCLPDHKSRRRPIILNSRLPLHVESWKCDRRDRHLPQIDKHWQLDMCSNTKSIPFSGRISPGTNRIRGLIFIVPRFKADLFFLYCQGKRAAEIENKRGIRLRGSSSMTRVVWITCRQSFKMREI